MKFIIKNTIALAFILLLGVSVFAQKEWLGNYEFDEDGGKTTGGTTIFIAHEMDVREADEGFVVMLQSNGYQTSKDLICTAKAQGNKLLIYFDSYGENNMFENYRKGDLLLTLEKKAAKGNSGILTYWGKFTPSISKNEKTGKVYFKKTIEKE